MGCCSSADEEARKRNLVNPAQEYSIATKVKVRGADGIEHSEAGTYYSAINTEEASEIARLSRAESVSKMTNEPSSIMMTLRRKFIITRAMLQHGINEDVNQFHSEIQESIADMREKDRRRVREWLDSVNRALRGRKPTDFPPVNPKKKGGGVGRGHRRSGSDAGSVRSNSNAPSTKPSTLANSTNNNNSKGATPQSGGLEHLSPSAQILEEFGETSQSNPHNTSGTTRRHSSGHNLGDGGSRQSDSTAQSSVSDQNSTKAMVQVQTPLTQEGSKNQYQNAHTPKEMDAHDLGGMGVGQNSQNSMAGSPTTAKSDTSSPAMPGRVPSVADSVQAVADGDEKGHIKHQRPTAHSLGQD